MLHSAPRYYFDKQTILRRVLASHQCGGWWGVGFDRFCPQSLPRKQATGNKGIATRSFLLLVVRMLLVAMPGAPSSVLAPSSKSSNALVTGSDARVCFSAVFYKLFSRTITHMRNETTCTVLLVF